MGRPGSWLALALGLGALGFSAWYLARPAEEEAAPALPPFVLPVTLARVELGELRPRASLSGTVRAAQRASLAFEVSGTVREVLAEEAQVVPAGDLLARLDRTDEELELAAAEAAQVLALREQALLAAGEREEEKRRLAAVLESARAEEDLARNEVERGERLLASRVLSESEQDRRVSELRVAEKRRAAFEQELARALAGTRAEDLAIAAARVDQARARVATARHELAKAELRAPWSGRVLARFVSPGAYVENGAAVYELIDLEHLEIHIDVPGRLVERLGAETRARVRLAGAGARAFETALDALLPAADEAARSFRAILRLGPGDDGLAELKPGLFLDVELLLQPLTGVQLVPSDCVLGGEGGPRLVRAAPGPADVAGRPALVAEFVAIRVLAEDGGLSAVESVEPGAGPAPLAVGDAVLLSGADSAFPGATLLPRESGGPDEVGASR
jgi:multidrug efflux pump subunit AcrA (membrane-fusion protein)